MLDHGAAMTLTEIKHLRAAMDGLPWGADAPPISVDELRELLDLAERELRRQDDRTVELKVGNRGLDR